MFSYITSFKYDKNTVNRILLSEQHFKQNEKLLGVSLRDKNEHKADNTRQ